VPDSISLSDSALLDSPTETPVEAPEFEAAERANVNDMAPQDDRALLPVVGLGASAGGVGALQTFFGRMPPNTGMAFVVVMHLSDKHESSLPEIIQTRTEMPVVQVRALTRLEANHVYVIPPSHHLVMRDGNIELSTPQQARGTRVAVDLLFRSLAVSQRSKAVAVVLSGTDGDGAIGIKRVKEQGGVTIAQDPDEAQYDGMPRSAIETGMVDWVLPVKEIADKLVEWIGNENRISLPSPETIEGNGGHGAAPDDPDALALREIIGFLRTRTGHDFTHYKNATVLRRILRRLQVNTLETLPAYAAFLRTHPGEAGALLQDLLISVTNFFRDPEAFIALEAFLPSLMRGKKDGEPVRAWVPACATGEEAYSLVMLLMECGDKFESPPEIQIFATDLDENALRFAREGLYPQSIIADVSPERLRRFFTNDQGRYRIRKEVRERMLFASHNILRDPAFSRLDLVSCRNLLIYFNRTAQDQVLDTFHFALRAGGLLLLGASESVDDQPIFTVRDKKHRIFERAAVSRPQAPIPVLSAQGAVPLALPSFPQNLMLPPSIAGIRGGEKATSYGELHLQMLEQIAPPSVLVGANYEVVHLSERAGQYLRFAGGQISVNLLSMVPDAIRLDLQSALFRAFQKGEDASVAPVRVERDGEERFIGARVHPMRSILSSGSEGESVVGFALVIFEERDLALQNALPALAAPDASPSDGEVAGHLDEELQHLKSFVRVAVEQYEASSEELRASNEELQAMNEEQRSAREELETSREEIQAANEELTTLNSELKSKVEEVSRSNSDLQNLMASTGLATVFLNRELQIKRYTPRAVEVFRLIPTDVGRPLSDLRHGFSDEDLMRDAEQVLDSLRPIEREIRTRDDDWFLLRVLPYRTIEDKIDGVVLTFLEITARKRAEAALREREQELVLMMETAPICILYLDAGEKLRFGNHLYLSWLGKSAGEAFGQPFADLIGAEAYTTMAPYLARVWAGETVEYEGRLSYPARGERDVFVRHAPEIVDGKVRGIVIAVVDVTEQNQALAQSDNRLRIAIEAGELGTWDWNLIENRTTWSEQRARLLGMEACEVEQSVDDLPVGIHPDDAPRVRDEIRRAIDRRSVFQSEFRIVRADTGEVRWLSGYGRVAEEKDGRAARLSGVSLDITERKAAERGRDQLMSRIVQTQEEERRRISRDLHDNLGQHLTAVMLGLQSLEAQVIAPNGERAAQNDAIPQLANLRALVDGLMKAAHRQAWELRPPELDDMGLEIALRHYTSDWSARTSVPVDFQAVGWDGERADPAVETTFYRVVQEALTNVARHADAAQVSVVLERSGTGISAIIEDDGGGFESDSEENGRLGLLGMRERMTLIGGTLEIESAPQTGTTVFARFAV